MNRRAGWAGLLFCLPLAAADYTPPTAQALKSVNTTMVCRLWRGRKLPVALTELKRRKEFTDRELALIEVHKVDVGMREPALLCSWGEPQRRNRTATVSGVSVQYVYYDTVYIYVEKGVVVSWQD
jgi:hypothetical protein